MVTFFEMSLQNCAVTFRVDVRKNIGYFKSEMQATPHV